MDMPKIGLGTWQLSTDETADVVARAIDLGYRHIDTAQMYGNEAEVGAGIRTATLPRDQVFLTTKVHQDRFTDGTALASARESIDKIGIGPVDLILCHWPPQGLETAAVIDDLKAMQADGLTKHIGISNFNVPQMRRAAERASILTNQVEFHPLIDQSRLLDTARETGMSLTAYMPIIRGEALTLPDVVAIANETGRSPAAVVLRWIVQQGVIALCKSSKESRLLGNLEALEFDLTDAQMARISALTVANKRYCDMAGWSPDWDA